MRLTILPPLLLLAAPVVASPPPAPPPYVMAAAEVLAAPAPTDPATVVPLFAADVVATQNGVVVARGRAAWLAWRAREMGFQRHVLGVGEGWSRDDKGGGELMVVDTFEDFDRARLPANYLADPRTLTRSTLYRFGKDGVIHGVDVSRVEGFWMWR